VMTVHRDGATKATGRKARGVPYSKNGRISVFQVNPGVWQAAVKEAQKHGVKPTRIDIISTTLVEFTCP
jgi:uncharacterized Zn finger protein